MAESDGKPASSPLSTEEADRLSEKFKPSWEAEPDPPTVPKVEPPKNLKQTLLGIAAPVPSGPPPATPAAAPDDLDWELPTNAANAAPAPVEEAPIEPPPKSNPSGIGQTYKPKDTDAPAIVLTDEVKRAEETARAQLAAEHRARRAPTILKFKAIDAPYKSAADDVNPSAFVPPKKGLGVWIGLGAGAISVALIGIMVVARGTSSPEPAAPPPEIKAAAPAAAPEPPPPPPAPVPEPPAEPATAAPSVERPAIEVAPAASPEPPAKPAAAAKLEPAPPKPPAAAKPVPTPKPQKPVAAAPKPAAPTPKPASPAQKPATTPKPASGAIVRDAPF